jgi:cytoskeletal protein CcmA (bactofilin family)
MPRSTTAAQPGGTFIGPNITIEGTVSGSERVVVEGTVKGQINITADLLVGTKARVEATVHARNVTVEGNLNGDVSADDRVELVASATVDGNIKAPKIIVAEGAKFRGSVDMGSRVPQDEPAPAKAK